MYIQTTQTVYQYFMMLLLNAIEYSHYDIYYVLESGKSCNSFSTMYEMLQDSWTVLSKV